MVKQSNFGAKESLILHFKKAVGLLSSGIMQRNHFLFRAWLIAVFNLPAFAAPPVITEAAQAIHLVTETLDASINKQGYVSGIAAGSLLDHRTGFRDAGFGLDIIDWLMEPGSDEAYRDSLPGDLPYRFGDLFHGRTPKRSVEGPQICTQAKILKPTVVRGADFVAIRQEWNYTLAAPGRKAGSTWTQQIVFPAGKRYFISSDRIHSLNDSPALFFRMDMPGHIKHTQGDSFSEVYLSYHGLIPAAEFREDFAPDAKFNYTRARDGVPKRSIRAYHLRDPKTGAPGPWLAGMTLNAGDVAEAWCHQRGYVCLIQEIGGRPIKAGESFGAAFIIGYFDSVAEMESIYDVHAGHSGLEVSEVGWKLLP